MTERLKDFLPLMSLCKYTCSYQWHGGPLLLLSPVCCTQLLTLHARSSCNCYLLQSTNVHNLFNIRLYGIAILIQLLIYGHYLIKLNEYLRIERNIWKKVHCTVNARDVFTLSILLCKCSFSHSSKDIGERSLIISCRESWMLCIKNSNVVGYIVSITELLHLLLVMDKKKAEKCTLHPYIQPLLLY